MASKGVRDPSSHRTPAQIQKMDHGYEATPKMKKHRAENNAARAIMEKAGKVHKGDGKDVDHKHMLKDGGGNAKSNLRVKTQHWNRGWAAREK